MHQPSKVTFLVNPLCHVYIRKTSCQLGRRCPLNFDLLPLLSMDKLDFVALTQNGNFRRHLKLKTNVVVVHAAI